MYSEHNYVQLTQENIISIVGLNVCGLSSKLNLGILEEFAQDFDILCMSETKCDQVDVDAIPGFCSFVMPRKNNLHRYGGVHGLCVFIKNGHANSVCILENTTCDSVFWLKIDSQLYGEPFILGSVYLPHENSPFFDKDVFDDFANDLINLRVAHDIPFVLVGDFNSRTGIESDFIEFERSVLDEIGVQLFDDDSFYTKSMLELLNIETARHNKDRCVNNNGKSLLEMCRSLDLKILNGRVGEDHGIGDFTCHNSKGKSTIDYILVSPELFPKVKDFSVHNLDYCMSDSHCAISMSLTSKNINPNVISSPPSSTCNDEPRSVPSPSSNCLKAKWDPHLRNEFKAAFNEHEVGFLNDRMDALNLETVTQAEIDDIAKGLCNLYIEPAKKLGMCKIQRPNYKKQTQSTSKTKPWFDPNCKALRKEYFRVKNRLKRRKTEESRLELKARAKEYKRFIKSTTKSYRRKLHQTLRNLKKSKPKDYWDIISNANKQPEKICKIAITTFMEHFKKLSNKAEEGEQRDNSSFDPRNITHSINESINRLFTILEVKTLIFKLKNNKACGIDNILNEYMKNCPENVIAVIVKLFNIVLQTGIVPTDWCIGLIKPLYKKKGSIDDPDNYRGITLLSCIGKLFTACLNERLSSYLESAGIMGEEQAGFREGYSTLDHIFVLHSLIEQYLFKHKRIYCAFIDYKKSIRSS